MIFLYTSSIKYLCNLPSNHVHSSSQNHNCISVNIIQPILQIFPREENLGYSKHLLTIVKTKCASKMMLHSLLWLKQKFCYSKQQIRFSFIAAELCNIFISQQGWSSRGWSKYCGPTTKVVFRNPPLNRNES